MERRVGARREVPRLDLGGAERGAQAVDDEARLVDGEAVGAAALAHLRAVPRLVEAQLVLGLLAAAREGVEAGDVVVRAVLRLELPGHLLHDEQRAPRRVLLAAQDVAEDVVAHVQDRVAVDAEHALEVLEVALLVDLAALERVGGLHGVGAAVDEALEVRALVGEERRLARGDAHDVEVLPPRRVLVHRAVEQVRHHLLRVAPPRVRQQEQLLPRRSQLVERRSEARVAVDEARQVVGDDVDDGAVAVRLVDALADVGEELPVVDVHAVRVEHRHGACVHRRLGERVERVDPVVALRRDAHLAGLVEGVAHVALELAQPVPRAAHVAVPVHLQDVPEALVDEQPADGEARVVRRLAQERRIPPLHELAHRGLDGEPVDLLLAVDRERVVHVEADPLDGVHAQASVHEHAAFGGERRDVGGRVVGHRELQLGVVHGCADHRWWHDGARGHSYVLASAAPGGRKSDGVRGDRPGDATT